MSEFHAWVLFREKYGPLTLHMRVDRAGALVAQAHRGGSLQSRMPWGKQSRSPDVPSHVSSPSAAVQEYTDKQLAENGLYRDENGTIRRKVSNVGKRVVGGRIVSPESPDFDARVKAAQKAQERMRSMDKRTLKG